MNLNKFDGYINEVKLQDLIWEVNYTHLDGSELNLTHAAVKVFEKKWLVIVTEHNGNFVQHIEDLVKWNINKHLV